MTAYRQSDRKEEPVPRKPFRWTAVPVWLPVIALAIYLGMAGLFLDRVLGPPFRNGILELMKFIVAIVCILAPIAGGVAIVFWITETAAARRRKP